MERRNSGSISTYQESLEDFNIIQTTSLRWYILLVFSLLGVWQVIWAKTYLFNFFNEASQPKRLSVQIHLKFFFFWNN